MSGLNLKNNINIITGNAIVELKNIKTETVDLIIADPPYNLGKDYGNNLDNKEFDEYISFSEEWLKEATRILKPSGTIYVFMGVRFISYIFNILDKNLGLVFNSWICWHYTQGIGKKIGFSPRHDDILMFSKTKNYKFNLDNVRIPQKFYRTKNNMRGANPGDVWHFSHVHYCNNNRQQHPTQKPEGLIERMILASTDEGDYVLDPFAGSGTTLRVCQLLKRKCLGIELNNQYVLMIKERLKKPFNGFDSIDPRMTRIPKDINDTVLKEQYLRNHKKWFLKNHRELLNSFETKTSQTYLIKNCNSQKEFEFWED
jgi:DNA modification methylase